MYAACIVANYQNVEKDMCKDLFIDFKNCVQQKVSSGLVGERLRRPCDENDRAMTARSGTEMRIMGQKYSFLI